jgi:DNA-binding response OmpR family regulator
MTSPLALIFYENLLTGNQLINRLSDLGYRAKAVGDVTQFPSLAAAEKPIVVVVELGALAERVCGAVRILRSTPTTEHVPVLALFKSTSKAEDCKLTAAAQAAGVTLLAHDEAFLSQLPELLQQVLDVP